MLRLDIAMRDGDLVLSGITGVDRIFLGGIRRGNVILVDGATGSGKTLLGMEFICRGIAQY